jgi:hypothetical protein
LQYDAEKARKAELQAKKDRLANAEFVKSFNAEGGEGK